MSTVMNGNSPLPWHSQLAFCHLGKFIPGMGLPVGRCSAAAVLLLSFFFSLCTRQNGGVPRCLQFKIS